METCNIACRYFEAEESSFVVNFYFVMLTRRAQKVRKIVVEIDSARAGWSQCFGEHSVSIK